MHVTQALYLFRFTMIYSHLGLNRRHIVWYCWRKMVGKTKWI